MVEFGLVVCGPPGSGKTTFCEGCRQFLNEAKIRTVIINLDFANDWKIHDSVSSDVSIMIPDIDVRSLIKIEDVMEKFKLGPNGSLLYCMRHLYDNLDWLIKKISEYKKDKNLKNVFYIIDCPGQVELYTLDDFLRKILNAFTNKNRSIRMIMIHLVDVTLCSNLDQYISALLVSLSAQMSFEVPFLNIFNKFDLFDQKTCDLPIEMYADIEAPEQFIDIYNEKLLMSEELSKYVPDGLQKIRKIAEKKLKFYLNVCEQVEAFSLLPFTFLNVENKESMIDLISVISKIIGFDLLKNCKNVSN